MHHITIKDIARMAGVSVTTVSRALNNAPEIREETRAHILEICSREGYRTNLLARSLISNRTNVLGVVLPDLSSPFHAALALYIETCASELGYQVMLCSGQPGDDRIDDLFDFLIGQQVDGILLTSASNSAMPLLERYQYVYCVSGALELLKEWITGGFPVSERKFAEIIMQMSMQASSLGNIEL